ncbi:hypothetical protein TNCV_270791, partial [Trichonephila clavipes]
EKLKSRVTLDHERLLMSGHWSIVKLSTLGIRTVTCFRGIPFLAEGNIS